MKKICACCLCCLLFLASCQQRAASLTDKPEPKSKSTASKITKKVAIIKGAITLPCAVVITPDDSAIDRMKKADTGETYDVVVDDNVYFMDQASTFLDSVGLKQIQKRSHGSVSFETPSGGIFNFRLDTLTWAIILFNGKTKPIFADMSLINNDYATYMKK